MAAAAKSRGGSRAGGPSHGGNNNTRDAAGKMTVDQQHYLLQVRDVGITEGQLSDDRILTLLHDNGNDVAGLVQRYFDGERPGSEPPPRVRPLAHARARQPI